MQVGFFAVNFQRYSENVEQVMWRLEYFRFIEKKLYSVIMVYWQIQKFTPIVVSQVKEESSVSKGFVLKCQTQQSLKGNVVNVVVLFVLNAEFMQWNLETRSLTFDGFINRLLLTEGICSIMCMFCWLYTLTWAKKTGTPQALLLIFVPYHGFHTGSTHRKFGFEPTLV